MFRVRTIVLPAMLASCASAPTPEYDASLEEQFRSRNEEGAENAARRDAIERVLLDLNNTIDNYAGVLLNWGSIRTEHNAERLREYIRETAVFHFDALVAAADSPQFPRNQAIAVAALGFSERPDALSPILNAAASENVEVANNAVFGLAMLGDARTPPQAIARVMRDPNQSPEAHANAAWALYQLQKQLTDQTPVVEIWREIAAREIDATEPRILVSAIRGIGFNRDPQDAANVEKFVSHPVPLVRQIAAIALGRLGNDSAVEPLLTLIGPAEANENVRLAARKALQRLAGSEDRRYDVQEWREVFDRKS